MLSNRYLPFFALGTTLVLMSWAGHHAQAATIHVDGANTCPGAGTLGDPYCSIQAAINAATSGVDEVVVAPETYNEIIDFSGKKITVRSTDPNSPAVVAATIIDATGVTEPDDGLPVVRCDNGETAATVLNGFTITGGTGDTEASGGTPVGGGMFNNAASPTVINCTFSGNTAASGAGMLNKAGASPTVTNCTFSGNMATSFGGGMTNSNSSPTVTNCTFSGNTAGSGGGMSNDSSNPTVTNCTFNQNTATSDGGGMLNFFSSPTVANCIFWGNSDAGGMDESGQIHTDGGTPTVNFSDVKGTWTGSGSNNIDANPLFVDADGPDDMIGTQDDNLRLQAGSPCIDAGDNGALMDPNIITSDLDHRLRFVDDLLTTDTGSVIPPTVDMGAYEYACTGNLDDVAAVTLPDFALFAQRWMQTDCGLCGGADFTGDHDVTLEDLLIQMANWLCGTGL